MKRGVLADLALMLLQYGVSATAVAITLVIYSRRKDLQRIIFAFFYGRFVAPNLVVQLAPLKEELFATLARLTSFDPKLKSTNSLRILEIGIGTGINLQYYPKGTRLISVEPNPHFQDYFSSNRAKFGHVKLERFVSACAEDMHQVEDESVDVVVSTYVLCSVNNCDAVLKEILRVLAPGGLFLYLEHVGFPSGSWSRAFQRLIEPVWTPVSDGCRLTRDSSAFVRLAGFTSVKEKTVEVSGVLYPTRPHLVGTAVK